MRRGNIGGALALVLAVLLLAAGCAADRDEKPMGKAYFTYFDTVSYVYSYAGDSAEQFESCSADVSGILEEYHKLLDIYHEYSDIPNLCTINRLAGGEPVPVDRKLVDFLLYARELYDQTGGEMNIMFGAVTALWHECRSAVSQGAAAALPTPAQLAAAAEHTDISLLEIDERALTVRLTDPDARLDVGAVGKGYATERAAEYLAQAGKAGYVLNTGGNIRIIGTKPDGGAWVTGIRDPAQDAEDFALRVRLQNTACVTSGVYERYFTLDGTRYHHIIDPDTLYPAAYYASLSVVTPDSALADALSTALFCMPYEESAALAQKLGVDVIWIFPDGGIRWTPGLEDRIEQA